MNKIGMVVVLVGVFCFSLSQDSIFAGPPKKIIKTEISAKFTLPGFIQLMSQDGSIFLIARKDIKPEYADPCTQITWEGEPEKFFAKNVADAIRLARPVERQNRAMQMGVLVRGDLNLCRIREGLQPVRGFCPGGAVETGVTLPNLQRPFRWQDRPRVVNPEDLQRSSHGQRNLQQRLFLAVRSLFTRPERPQTTVQPLWQGTAGTGAVAINTTAIEGIEELPIIFYEPCEDFPARSTASDRCGPGPVPSSENSLYGVELSGGRAGVGLPERGGLAGYGVELPSGRADVGFPEGGGFAGSPIGPDSINDRSGQTSQGDGHVDNSHVTYRTTYHRDIETSGGDRTVTIETTTRVDHDGDYNVTVSGYVQNPSTGGSSVLDMERLNNNGELAPPSQGSGGAYSFSGNIYTRNDQNAASARQYTNDAADQNGVTVPGDCPEGTSLSCNQADVNQARMNEKARAYEQERRREMQAESGGNAGRPMCDFASSDGCGGDYTFAGFPLFPAPDPIMDNLPSTHRERNEPVDCLDGFCEGGGEIPEFIPGTRISTVRNDPLGPYVNPVSDDTGGASRSIGTLPCGVLAVDVSYTYATDCMDPMDTNCWQPMQRNIDNLTQPAGRRGRQSPQIAPAPQSRGQQINRSIFRIQRH